MKLSLCNEVIRDMPFAEQCAFAAAVGYDGLEIAPFTLSDAPDTLDAGEVRSIRGMIEAEGLVCSSLHWLLVAPGDLSITSADRAVRQRTVDVIRRLVDIAAELGADILVHGSPGQRRLPEIDPDSARARGLECFAAAAQAAEAAGVVYCVEPLARPEANFVNTLDEAIALVREIASPAFRTMLDCCATSIEEGDVVAALDSYYPSGLITHVQVNDTNRRGPGEGDLEFAPIVSALNRHDYQGWVAVEPFIYEPDGPACAARSCGYMRGVLEALA